MVTVWVCLWVGVGGCGIVCVGAWVGAWVCVGAGVCEWVWVRVGVGENGRGWVWMDVGVGVVGCGCGCGWVGVGGRVGEEVTPSCGLNQITNRGSQVRQNLFIRKYRDGLAAPSYLPHKGWLNTFLILKTCWGR